MAQQPPAFRNQNKQSQRFRRVPPAVFPPILGSFGLAIAWTRAAEAFSITPAIGQLLTGVVVALYLFALGAYLIKLGMRPSVLLDDLKVLPGRAGIAAMTMSGMLMAAVLTPLWAPVGGGLWMGVAKGLLAVFLAFHLFVAVLVFRMLAKGPAEGRVVTPVMHLTFVGVIVAPLAALPLGWVGVGQSMFLLALVAALTIWALSIRQFLRQTVPAPLRPLLAIHLAPASLLGTASALLGQGGLALAFGVLAIAILAVLLIRWKWVTEAGFTPFWGAFTFPAAAFSSLMMILGTAGYGSVFRLLGAAGLIASSVMIPWIAAKVVQMWIKGSLAVKSNAAEV